MRMTPAVLNLLIINVLLLAASYVLGTSSLGIDLDKWLGLHYITASDFGVWQFVSFIFMHSGFSHLFFNMFALWMFGTVIENSLGTQKFVIYYLVCGIGSGIVQEIAMAIDINPLIAAVDQTMSDTSFENVNAFVQHHVVAFSSDSKVLITSFLNSYNGVVNSSPSEAAALAREFLPKYQEMYINTQNTVGASGAVFGILLAFGMLFPNMRIMLMIPPIPMKAKWFVIIYGLIELFCGIHGADYDNVAHWAHLGGMLFGFLLLKYWKVQRIY